MSYRGPKTKRSRRLGVALTPKAERGMAAKPHMPGMHGPNMRRQKISDYGKQLLEKQRLRYQYNLRERQLTTYFRKAAAKAGNTGEVMIGMLETRLDVMVLRAGLARTIYQGRQLVVHGHVLINGKKCDRPGAPVKVGDKISIKEKSKGIDGIRHALESTAAAEYMLVDAENLTAELTRVPSREDVPVICDLALVIEYYAR